jgi:hypothetical protein
MAPVLAEGFFACIATVGSINFLASCDFGTVVTTFDLKAKIKPKNKT